ncbi:MAG: hypothetical protein H5T43_10775, partial [Methanomethylovorans sp.]|nr:hypothetical protein [Methanomethylovorans sp.]
MVDKTINSNNELAEAIRYAIFKFDLNLDNQIILTEAATGHYSATAIIAALAGAKKVYAYTRNSSYGSVEDVQKQTNQLAEILQVSTKIEIITCKESIDLKTINIVTNTGFLRPLNRDFIKLLSPFCVIPLMWEPWEFRKNELDLDACSEYGIKVYGTNEEDKRLRTKEYLGWMVLKLLLEVQQTPLNSKVLVLGSLMFTSEVDKILKQNNYSYTIVHKYDHFLDIHDYTSIIVLEHQDNILLVGAEGFIRTQDIKPSVKIIHICGNVDFSELKQKDRLPSPAPFGYMTYTVDYIGAHVVVDLHTAGLKV